MACLGSTVNVTGQHSRPRWGALGGAIGMGEMGKKTVVVVEMKTDKYWDL